jgi:hypothetical protein
MGYVNSLEPIFCSVAFDLEKEGFFRAPQYSKLEYSSIGSDALSLTNWGFFCINKQKTDSSLNGGTGATEWTKILCFHFVETVPFESWTSHGETHASFFRI